MKRTEFLLGQDAVRSYLDNVIEHGHPHHAYLFLGRPGVGRLTAARYLAMGLNCEELIKPCLECSACGRISRLVYLDVRQFRKDQKTVFSVDAMRQAIKESYLCPMEARYKVFIFYPETFQDEAANAFLKTLEEPSPSTVFVLLAGTVESVLPTIRSRCIPVNFNNLDDDTMRRLLTVDRDIPPAQLASVLAYSRGSVTTARFMLATGFIEFYRNLEQQFASGRTSDLFRTVHAGLKEFINVHRDALGDEFGEKDIYLLIIDLLQRRLVESRYNNSLQNQGSPLQEKQALSILTELREGIYRDLNAGMIFGEAVLRLRATIAGNPIPA